MTEDATLAKTVHGGDVAGLWRTELWQDDWFGNASGSAIHVVEKGRFAYQTVGSASKGGTSNPCVVTPPNGRCFLFRVWFPARPAQICAVTPIEERAVEETDASSLSCVLPRAPRRRYGLLRAPWSVNKSPYLTRAHSFCGESFDLDLWPSCAVHHNLTFNSAYVGSGALVSSVGRGRRPRRALRGARRPEESPSPPRREKDERATTARRGRGSRRLATT